MQSVTIGENQAGQRLDKFLHKYLPLAGTGFLYKMLRKKNITLNGKKAEGSELLARGDRVCFFFSPETFAKFSGQSGQEPILDANRERNGAEISQSVQKAPTREYLHGVPAIGSLCMTPQKAPMGEYLQAYDRLRGVDVIYEDDHILILNKPAGVLTQKAKREDVSLNEWAIGYLLTRDPGFEKEMAGFRPSVCNRLDRNTSGLVLCGKSLPGLQYLSQCIRERSIRKFYRTICVGQLWEEARIKGYLLKDQEKNRVYIAQEKGNLSESSYIETGYRPLFTGERYTYLEVELITGKPHQIRAHLAGMGHPLIGDFKYGDRKINEELRKDFGLQHQLLQACRVVFPECSLPAGRAVSGKTFTAPETELSGRLRKELGLKGRNCGENHTRD